MAENVSLTNLISYVQLRCDNHRLTSAQITTFINQAYSQLHDKLSEAFAEDYKLNEVQFATTSSTTSYPLSYLATFSANSGTFTAGLTVTGGTSGATGVIQQVLTVGGKTVLDISQLSFVAQSGTGEFQHNETITDTSTGTGTYDKNNGGIGAGDFYKLRGLDIQYANLWLPLKPYVWRDRTSYQNANLYAGTYGPYFRYRVQGDSLILQPTPSSKYTMKFSYTPHFVPLVNSTDTLDGVNGWEEWIVLSAARMCLINEESDTSQIERQLAEINARIDKMAASRMTGEPEFVAAVARSSSVDPLMLATGMIPPFGDDW